MQKVHIKFVKFKLGIGMWCKTTVIIEGGKKKQIVEWFREKPLI